jgi:CheY-like chemotaxis protein
MKVMIVEDEVIAALATEKMLQKLGFEVCGNMTTGEEALEAAASSLPDLVIMDVCLDGELDGIETAALLKRFRDMPVIYVTAYSDDSTRARADATGPLAYLIKPLDMALLRQALEGLSPSAASA